MTFPKKLTIEYTPQTMAAAVAKNIRAEQALRDRKDMLWNQGSWGEISIEKLGNQNNLIQFNMDTVIDDDGAANFRVNQGYERSKELVGFSCPTTGCTAGWITSLAGDVFITTMNNVLNNLLSYEDDEGEIDYTYLDNTDTIGVTHCYIKDQNRISTISERAAEIMGMGYTESNWFFQSSNNLATILSVLDHIATGGSVLDSPAYLHDSYGHWDGNEYHNQMFGDIDSCKFCNPPDELNISDERELDA